MSENNSEIWTLKKAPVSRKKTIRQKGLFSLCGQIFSSNEKPDEGSVQPNNAVIPYGLKDKNVFHLALRLLFFPLPQIIWPVNKVLNSYLRMSQICLSTFPSS